MTAKNLVYITLNNAFKGVVSETGMVIYKKPSVFRSGRSTKATKKKRIDYFVLEMCVILWKSKVVAVKGTSQLVTVRCNQSGESVSNSSLLVGGAEMIKKRGREDFVFRPRDLNITLCAPIETLDKPTSKVTCVPSGKTNK